VAATVLDAGTKLLTALEEHGYALAKVETPVATEDDGARAIDVSFKVDTGPRVEIGAIAFKGLHDVHEAFARRSLRIHTGQLYQPSRIEAARQALLALGVFSGVAVHGTDRLDRAGRIPLTFEIQERPEHAVAFSGAYSTDLGLSLSAGWSDRNLLGNAEQLNLSAAGTELGGTATAGLGYNLTAQFIEPEFMARQNDLELDLTGIKQQFIAYDQTAETLAGFVRRRLSVPNGREVSASPLRRNKSRRKASTAATSSSRCRQAQRWTLRASRIFCRIPRRGIRANLNVTPTRSFGRSASIFTILSASVSTYFDLSDSANSVIALRVLAGSAIGASQFDLPPDERLYAGGSGTIRGYRYQTVGPLFPDDNPIGGTSLDAAAIELRQRLVGNWGAAFFADAGQASAQAEPFTGTLRVGAGAGLRYYTPIGPVRLDIAVPVTPIPHGDAFELYIGLGQAF
jgi:translocation and assembly module TamA